MLKKTSPLTLFVLCFALAGCDAAPRASEEPARAASSTPAPPTLTATSTPTSPTENVVPARSTTPGEDATESRTSSTPSAPNPIFAPILPTLETKTRVPVRLPVYLAEEKETNPLYAIVEAATPARYEIQIAFTEDCDGQNVCRWGSVSGQGRDAGTKPPGGKPVPLTSGITGYFTDAKCGATGCTDSTLSWQQDGYLYTVGSKAAKLETLKRIAESAIGDSHAARNRSDRLTN